jgi:hypothetical protein
VTGETHEAPELIAGEHPVQQQFRKRIAFRAISLSSSPRVYFPLRPMFPMIELGAH